MHEDDGFIHFIELEVLLKKNRGNVYAACGQILYKNTTQVNIFHMPVIGIEVTCTECMYSEEYNLWLLKIKG